MLKVLIPATVGIIALLAIAVFAFRPAEPDAKVAEASLNSDTRPNVGAAEEDSESAERNSTSQKVVTEETASRGEVTSADDDGFFPKSVKTYKPGEPVPAGNDSATSANVETGSAESVEANPPAVTKPQAEDITDPLAPTAIAPLPQETAEPEKAKLSESTSGTEERNPLSFAPGNGPVPQPNSYSPLSLNPPPADADSKAEKEGPLDKDSPEYLARLFHAADHNHDEFLDPTETPMHIIHRVDKNKDHLASLREMETAFKSRKQELFKPPTAAELKILQQQKAGRGPGGPFGGRPPGPPPR